MQISTDRKFSVVVDSNDTLSPYYAPWQGRTTPMPPGAYWWHVLARDTAGNPLGDWSESRHFLVTDDLITGNEYDYVIPDGGTLLSTGDPFTYDAPLSLVATSTVTVAAPYNLGALHIAQDRSISANNRNWVVAFGTDAGVVGSLTYALYFDVNQLEGVGGPGDPLGKPIVFDDLYLPEYVIYLQRTDDTIPNATFYEWTGSGWEASSLVGLGGTFFYDPLSQSVQVIFPYTTIVLANEDQFSGAIALTVYSTPSTPNSEPIDSVPAPRA